MTANNNKQQIQSQAGPIAQQLAKIQTNGHRVPSNGQPPSTGQPQKKMFGWTGFSGKTLWDWLQFFGVLTIPFVVAVGTLYFTQQITQQQAQLSINANERQHQTDIQIAADRQREDVLVSYQKNISDLLLTEKLSSSKKGDVVREVARALTLTALRRLDPDRKGYLIKFLAEAQLLIPTWQLVKNTSNPIITLWYADLSYIHLDHSGIGGVDLSISNMDRANLSDSYLDDSDFTVAILSNADLSNSGLGGSTLVSTDLENANLNQTSLIYCNLANANLSNANLRGADFSHANLKGAKVTLEQLAQAKSLHGTTMPDGSIHP